MGKISKDDVSKGLKGHWSMVKDISDFLEDGVIYYELTDKDLED